jgi:hypothetical protein
MFVSTDLDVINQDDLGIGELVVSTLSNDYMRHRSRTRSR